MAVPVRVPRLIALLRHHATPHLIRVGIGALALLTRPLSELGAVVAHAVL